MTAVERTSPNGVTHLIVNGHCATCGMGEHLAWPRVADVHGWAHRNFEAMPTAHGEQQHAAIVERQLADVFDRCTDDEARDALATWNPRLDWDRVTELRDLADEVAAVEFGMPYESSYTDLLVAQDAYGEALRKLAGELRATAAEPVRVLRAVS